MIIGINGGPPVLLKNNAAKGNNWLGLKLEGVTCNRDAIGARIVWKAGDKVRARLKNNGGSYLSSHDLREVLGIGSADANRGTGNSLAGSKQTDREAPERCP